MGILILAGIFWWIRLQKGGISDGSGQAVDQSTHIVRGDTAELGFIDSKVELNAAGESTELDAGARAEMDASRV